MCIINIYLFTHHEYRWKILLFGCYSWLLSFLLGVFLMYQRWHNWTFKIPNSSTRECVSTEGEKIRNDNETKFKNQFFELFWLRKGDLTSIQGFFYPTTKKSIQKKESYPGGNDQKNASRFKAFIYLLGRSCGNCLLCSESSVDIEEAQQNMLWTFQ